MVLIILAYKRISVQRYNIGQEHTYSIYNIIIDLGLNVHTSDFLRLKLDLLRNDEGWDLISLYQPGRIVGLEMTWLVTMKAYVLLLTIPLHMTSFLTLETLELVTSKPVSSPTLSTHIMALLTSSRHVICIRLSTSFQSSRAMCPPFFLVMPPHPNF